jgi:hypothetical protein
VGKEMGFEGFEGQSIDGEESSVGGGEVGVIWKVDVYGLCGGADAV